MNAGITNSSVDDREKKDSQTHIPSRTARRRDKPQLSCTSCKQRKLKCDRRHPCETCAKRGHVSSCYYVPFNGKRSSQADSSSTANAAIQDKIQYLEEMVISLMETRNGLTTQPTIDHTTRDDNAEIEPQSGDNALNETCGRLDIEVSSVRYVDSTHWTAVLDGIAELKSHFEDDQSPLSSATSDATADHFRSSLLFNNKRGMTRKDVLRAVPPRLVADRLISNWFNEMDMNNGIVHSLTFIKEYEDFWTNLSSVTLTWLGLLFGILSSSSHFQTLVNDNTQDFPNDLGSFQEMEDTYRELAAQCLILSDYSNPGEYTVEAMLMYYTNEHFRSRDGQFGTLLIFGMVVRLALRMGYHRDPSHFPGISVFQGEMRRRVWTSIVQLDLMTSTQMGLPRMIQDFHWDTGAPHDIADSDFSEGSVFLLGIKIGSSGIATEYARVKMRSIQILGKISDIITSTRSVPYSRILRLDEELQKVQDSIPNALTLRPIAQSLADTTSLILRRYYLDLNFQKARCLLHQRYAVQARQDKQYHGSRKACIEASMRLLQHQLVFYEETRPGGRLFRERWKMSSFLSQDYFLAATIICVDLDHHLDLESEEDTGTMWTRRQMIEMLSASHDIWQVSAQSSVEAQKVMTALGIMLRKLQNRPSPEKSPDGAQPELRATTHVPDSSPQVSVREPPRISSEGLMSSLQEYQAMSPFFRTSSSFSTGTSPANQSALSPQAVNTTSATDMLFGGMNTMMDMSMAGHWDLWASNLAVVGGQSVLPGGVVGYTMPAWSWDAYPDLAAEE